MAEPSARDQILGVLQQLPDGVRASEADDMLGFLLDEFAGGFDTRDAMHADLFEAGIYYAIHGDDLKLLTEAATVAAAAYAAFPNPASILSGLVVFLFRYLRKRVRLDARHALVLREIAKSGAVGVSAESLTRSLPHSLRDREALDELLTSLARARKEDGTAAKLIEQEDGRYFALDL